MPPEGPRPVNVGMGAGPCLVPEFWHLLSCSPRPLCGRQWSWVVLHGDTPIGGQAPTRRQPALEPVRVPLAGPSTLCPGCCDTVTGDKNALGGTSALSWPSLSPLTAPLGSRPTWGWSGGEVITGMRFQAPFSRQLSPPPPPSCQGRAIPPASF